MINFGNTLKEAREAKNLTIADIADRTHMMSSMIADLENENFSRLAAPIYGRGFVKLYCETVGLDPTPMIAEFMEIFNGNREPAIRERVVTAKTEHQPEPSDPSGPNAAEEPVAVAEAKPEPTATPKPDTTTESSDGSQPDLFSTSYESPAEARTRQPEMPPSEPTAPVAPTSDGPVLTRYSSPVRTYATELPRMMPALGRWSVVLIGLFAVLAGLVIGIRALYRATNSIDSADEQASAALIEPAERRPAATDVKTSRTPVDVPQLYMD